MGITSTAAHWLLGFEWPLALMFGSLTVVTGPTVIVPLLRTVRPTARLANILRWEDFNRPTWCTVCGHGV